MRKPFLVGAIVGTLTTLTALASTALYIQKAIIEPIERKEEFIDLNRKKAARKRITH
ncbi:DUF3042 family protein [Lactococcus nasutitermitis]|uniref:DUF3042 family protein n=1 Tax=Lactococcus nasutitermitis TaxID=1652957 RepID=A0ABV9JDJ5_9LACT|nr:DUF3042 family protein [Lactococcus nasutitermitis]